MARLRNPFAFTPLPVIIFTIVIYAGFLTPLLVTHLTVPPPPSNPPQGINLTQAWADLQYITNGFHPYNSARNDDVREYLLSRIREILDGNRVQHGTENLEGAAASSLYSSLPEVPVVVVDDLQSNITFADPRSTTSVYFEGTNIIVFIRGSEDGYFHNDSSSAVKAPSGVLVNAHYDSVSTGYGATDDGMGVATVLQLLSHFTRSDKWPKRGVVLLLNNGEEDYLNGARAFARHPLSHYTHTFLNLEGAGAGGRATLFRSSDAEITKFYKNAKHPFGTIISGDAFKRGVIASQTDYVVFNGQLGLRGLDVAFFEPRSKYHTTDDSAREASLNSLWHMLGASIDTVEGLASDTSSEFEGNDEAGDRVDAGRGDPAAWWDMFGRGFALIRLHTLFALSVTFLVVTPILFIVLTVALVKADKYYLWARKKYLHSSDDDEPVHLGGWKGFFRFPVVFVVASGMVVGLSFLVTKVNPYIAYSSPFAVWSMMLSAWFAVAWFLLRGADAMRPSALTRAYTLIWMYSGAYALLIIATVAVQRYQLGSAYFLIIYFASIFTALLISFVELFFLPKKSAYAQKVAEPVEDSSSRPLTAATNSQSNDIQDDAEPEDANETTSLLRGERTTFARYGSRRHSASDELSSTDPEHSALPPRYGNEQPWSGYLPSSLWLLQFIVLAPITLVIIGQIGLLATSALAQTFADGSGVLTVYLTMSILTILLLSPVAPIMHRFTHHVPLFVFLIFIGTLIYNLVAFPFSVNNKLKVKFVQKVNCTTGTNEVSLTGLNEYVQEIIGQLPSTAGQRIRCHEPELATHEGLIQCAWQGLPPRVVPIEEPPHTVTITTTASPKATSTGSSSRRSATSSSSHTRSSSTSRSTSSKKKNPFPSLSLSAPTTSTSLLPKPPTPTTTLLPKPPTSTTTLLPKPPTSTTTLLPKPPTSTTHFLPPSPTSSTTLLPKPPSSSTSTTSLLPPSPEPTTSLIPPQLRLPAPDASLNLTFLSLTPEEEASYTNSWFHFNVSLTSNNSASFSIKPDKSTRACRILFDRPITKLQVVGGAEDRRFPKLGNEGSKEVRLWSRVWGRGWEVDVEWEEEHRREFDTHEGDTKLTGHVVCLWSDANDPSKIPALQEVWRFMPRWATVTKLGDGLVEGWKEFSL